MFQTEEDLSSIFLLQMIGVYCPASWAIAGNHLLPITLLLLFNPCWETPQKVWSRACQGWEENCFPWVLNHALRIESWPAAVESHDMEKSELNGWSGRLRQRGKNKQKNLKDTCSGVQPDNLKISVEKKHNADLQNERSWSNAMVILLRSTNIFGDNTQYSNHCAHSICVSLE